MIIPENIRTRLLTYGRLRQEIRKIRQIVRENPKSEFVKTIYKKFKRKFWLGSNQVNYYEIFTKAWSELLPDNVPEIIEMGGLKFINDHAFKTEYSDIFITGGALRNENLEQNKLLACEIISLLSIEGPYENYNVKVKKDDIVIDAGANMGLFSLFCISKEIKKVYAFEPQKSVIKLLKNNIMINNASNLIEIVPFGLSDDNGDYNLSHSDTGHSAGSIILKRNDHNDTEVIRCVTLDSWATMKNIPRIDFIKADIEGAERNMLNGAIEILKKFAPKLAICTYHLPDDPNILENLILKANPNYVIRHTSHKIFAYVPQR